MIDGNEARNEGTRPRLPIPSPVMGGEPDGDDAVPSLAQLIDAPALRSLLEDFYSLAHIPMSIADIHGELLVGVGWQDICARFHRAQPEALRCCTESDTQLTKDVPPGQCRLYKCKNNLWDLATPIMVGEHHIGNVLSGQFFFEDEPIDAELFKAQAKRYGFDEKEYLAALAAVPRLNRSVVSTGMSFLAKLAQMLSQLSYGNLMLTRSLTERNRLTESLRRNEVQLNQQRARLEEVVLERTAQLQESVSELEHYSYTLTHDLRAPLRAMQGFASMLLEDGQDSEPVERLQLMQRIANSAKRMDQLIRDALDYSRVVRGDLPLTGIDVAALLRGMVESYPDFQAPATQITIREPFPLVLANEGALTQCFSNLLGNAIKFVEPGVVPCVQVRAEERGDFVRLWVEDNGIGVPAGCHEKIFRMFERLSTRYDGTGVGLALVRKVVQRMGGQTGVESEPGEGSRFWFELRRAAPCPKL